MSHEKSISVTLPGMFSWNAWKVGFCVGYGNRFLFIVICVLWVVAPFKQSTYVVRDIQPTNTVCHLQILKCFVWWPFGFIKAPIRSLIPCNALNTVKYFLDSNTYTILESMLNAKLRSLNVSALLLEWAYKGDILPTIHMWISSQISGLLYCGSG